ncbi:MAG: four helix bundle protein [Bacteroidales bacterium]|jgi:four helix bundle protein
MGTSYTFSFEKLEVYKETKELIKDLYIITREFPESEKFGLITQIRRAAISTASNIAEGNSRKTSKDKIHFINIAFGSLMEVVCQIDISFELGFVKLDTVNKLRERIERIARMINGLRNFQDRIG